MDYEFQESDIIFSDQYHHAAAACDVDDPESRRYYVFHEMVLAVQNGNFPIPHSSGKKNRKQNSRTRNSPPVVIPHNGTLRYQSFSDDTSDEEAEGNNYENDGDIVPPHLIVGRRVAGKMTSSVCARNGRMLKGRHLSEVRNSILRMTGFLES